MKWINDFNVRPKTIKLEDNMGEKLLDIGLGNEFSVMTPKTRATKAKINKGHIKLSSFFLLSRETINKTKRPPREWEEIFANHVIGKGLTFQIYKETQ